MDETSRPGIGKRQRQKQRRRRPTLACLSCRQAKIRCDRQYPCGACARSRNKTCVYGTSPRSSELRGSGISSSVADTSRDIGARCRNDLAPVTPASTASTSHAHPHDHDHVRAHKKGPANSSVPILDANGVVNRLFLLERHLDESASTRSQLEKSDQRTASGDEESPSIESYPTDDTHATNQGVVSKTRYFGQSHWMNSIIHFKSIIELFESQSKDAKHDTRAVLGECKALGRTIKAQYSPGIINKFGTNIPTRDLADKLVDGYIRSLETVFRVVHVPSFKRDYERYWAAPESVATPFLIQLQLIMAIGCATYDETFSMRKSAVQWVTEAEYWLLGPQAKSRLTTTGLQNMILLMLARETSKVGADLTWIHVGSLLRTAYYMGLHRDPSRLPRMSRFDAEMRRRLWNTIIELELKTSLDAGGFPTISLDASDTRAPADVDDMSLLQDEGDTDTTVKRFTDMSAALALRESFRERLAICQMLNATPYRGTYDNTIQLHHRFTAAFKSSMSKLKGYKSSERQPTAFQCRFVEIMKRRYLMSLHLPYVGPALKDPTFSFSRKQVVETAVRMYQLLFPAMSFDSSRPLLPSGEDSEVLSTEGDDLARFAVCGAGFWRLLASQSSMSAINELQTMMQEDQGIGPPMPRPDLLSILRHSLIYYLTRIKAGETNVKGYLFSTALAGHMQALIEDETGSRAIESAREAVAKTEKVCLDILRQWARAMECKPACNSDEQFTWDSLMTRAAEWSDSQEAEPFYNLSSVESFLDTDDNIDFMSLPMLF
ncbi:hypothetical protein F4861DRAFT_280278 [Xylaria intraflava]|nr:hypothetical protein F4861DRAFT_280278 [Xylaria intraflava]